MKANELHSIMIFLRDYRGRTYLSPRYARKFLGRERYEEELNKAIMEFEQAVQRYKKISRGK